MPGIVIQITGEGAGAAEALRIIEERMAQTKAKGAEMGEALAAAGERIKGAFEMVGIAIGIREVFTQLREAVTAAGEFGEAISKAAERTGMAASTLSVLHYAADVTGSDFDKLVSGVSKMGKNMGEAADGNKKLAAAFKAAGIDVAALVGKSDGLDIAFQKLGKTLSATESPARRNQMMIALLGKAGSDSIPVLTDLALHFDTLKQKTIDSGRYLDELAAVKLKLLSQALKDMQERIGGAQVSFAEGLAPALQGVFTAFSQATNGSNLFQEAGKQMGLTVIPLAAAFMELGTFIREAADEYKNWKAAIVAADSGVGQYLDVGSEARKAASARHAAAMQEMHETAQDHKSAEDEERRFLETMKTLKGQIEGGATGSFGGSGEGGHGGGFGGTGSGDGISKLDRDFWLSNPRSVLEAIRQNEREISAAGVQAQKDAVEEARKQFDTDTSGLGAANLAGTFGPAKPDVKLSHNYDDDHLPGAPNYDDQDDPSKMQMAKQAAQTLGGFADQIAQQAERGKLSFKSLVDSAIADLTRWAIKVMEEKALIPALNALFGVNGGPNFNSAGYATTPSGQSYGGLMAAGGDLSSNEFAIVGEKGPELFAPGTSGSVIPNDVVKGMAQGSGGSRGAAPNVMINNVNNSSQNVDMKQGGVSWDAEARQLIIHTVLEDAASGGPIAGMLSGMAPR